MLEEDGGGGQVHNRPENRAETQSPRGVIKVRDIIIVMCGFCGRGRSCRARMLATDLAKALSKEELSRIDPNKETCGDRPKQETLLRINPSRRH